MVTDYVKYMQRAIELARLGAGNVSPNPMVGSVIVHDNQIIGEGWHEQYGGPHAEINAINSVADKSLLTASSIYVTLEPCSHTGKTPPCADAIIKYGFKKVVVGLTDPNPLVNGQGIKRLSDAGITVITNVLPEQCAALNKRFIHAMQHKQPYVILKWAQNANGLLAPDKSSTNFAQLKQLSNPFMQRLTHKWRTEEDALMVGTNTALIDNPSLTARFWPGRNPKRIILDLKGRLPLHLKVFTDGLPTLVATCKPEYFSHLKQVTIIPIKDPKDFINEMLFSLHQLGIQSLVVEGGAQLLQAFIDGKHWQEAQIISTPATFNIGINAPHISGQEVYTTQIDDNHLRMIIPA